VGFKFCVLNSLLLLLLLLLHFKVCRSSDMCSRMRSVDMVATKSAVLLPGMGPLIDAEDHALVVSLTKTNLSLHFLYQSSIAP